MNRDSNVTERAKQSELPQVRKQLLQFITVSEARRNEARRAMLAALATPRS